MIVAPYPNACSFRCIDQCQPTRRLFFWIWFLLNWLHRILLRQNLFQMPNWTSFEVFSNLVWEIFVDKELSRLHMFCDSLGKLPEKITKNGFNAGSIFQWMLTIFITIPFWDQTRHVWSLSSLQGCCCWWLMLEQADILKVLFINIVCIIFLHTISNSFNCLLDIDLTYFLKFWDSKNYSVEK